MSTYRDDLEAARLRLRALEDRLEERETELVELRKQLEKRSRPRVDTGKSLWRAMAIFAAVAGTLAAMSAPKPQQRAAPAASASDASVEAPTRPATPASSWPEMTVEMDRPSSPRPPPPPQMSRVHTAATAAVPRQGDEPSRPSSCGPRHDYVGPKALPKETTFVALGTCAGCACCAPDGAFRLAPDQDFAACSRCAADAALERGGLDISGALLSGTNMLASNSGLVRIKLEQGAQLFAVRVLGNVDPSPAGPKDETIALIGYDGDDRVADVARVDRHLIPTRYPDFEALKRYLVVEACGDAPLTHVELRSSEGTFAFAELAVLRAR